MTQTGTHTANAYGVNNVYGVTEDPEPPETGWLIYAKDDGIGGIQIWMIQPDGTTTQLGAGGGASVPLDEIAVGTGASVTGFTDFTWDDTDQQLIAGTGAAYSPPSFSPTQSPYTTILGKGNIIDWSGATATCFTAPTVLGFNNTFTNNSVSGCTNGPLIVGTGNTSVNSPGDWIFGDTNTVTGVGGGQIFISGVANSASGAFNAIYGIAIDDNDAVNSVLLGLGFVASVSNGFELGYTVPIIKYESINTALTLGPTNVVSGTTNAYTVGSNNIQTATTNGFNIGASLTNSHNTAMLIGYNGASQSNTSVSIGVSAIPEVTITTGNVAMNIPTSGALHSRVVCLSTTTGRLFVSTTGTDCSG